MNKIKVLAASLGTVISTVVLTAVSHAQVWTVASTTALSSQVEGSVANNIYGTMVIIIPFLIGVAVFFFVFRWLLSRGRGKH